MHAESRPAYRRRRWLRMLWQLDEIGGCADSKRWGRFMRGWGWVCLSTNKGTVRCMSSNFGEEF